VTILKLFNFYVAGVPMRDPRCWLALHARYIRPPHVFDMTTPFAIKRLELSKIPTFWPAKTSNYLR